MIGPRQFTVPELARRGFVEGRNLRLEWRFAGGVAAKLPVLAQELVETRVDLIVAISSVAARAAKGATSTIPIVMSFAGEDPVADGLAVSLARPGGNVTGLALLAAEGDLKRLEIFRQALPGATRVAYLMSPVREHVLTPATHFASASGFELTILTAAGRRDYEGVFESLARLQPAGLAVGSFPTFFNDASEIAARANGMGIPTICQWRDMALSGCTMSYGPPIGPLFERAGWYVAQVLKGEPPGQLPIEQPDRFELIVNLRAARMLKVALPPALLARADEVIE
jgi:putative ABC transport system substrate-binding protein